MEQPGCLHAGMDVYKWAFKLTPLVPSDLVADAFDLAREIRVLDMEASPYDLRELGYDPGADRDRRRARPPTSSASGRSPSARTPCATACSPCSTPSRPQLPVARAPTRWCTAERPRRGSVLRVLATGRALLQPRSRDRVYGQHGRPPER